MAHDRSIRAISEDGSFRVITLSTLETVTEIIKAQREVALREGREFSEEEARLLGQVSTGAALVRETMSPNYRVQITLSSVGSGSIMGDSHPRGLTRGLLQRAPEAAPLSLGGGTVLKVARVLRSGELNQGIVATRADQGLSEALTEYMLASEQITSFIGVATVLGDDLTPVFAGGFIVQLLPEVTGEALRPMTNLLERMPATAEVLREHHNDPAALMATLLEQFPHVILDASRVFNGCLCSESRTLAAFATLDPDELAEMFAGDQVVETYCDYCGKRFTVSAEKLAALDAIA
ncbi:MAG: Hsp33 family molecular chaperone HslO [Myxococcota bacterium]